MILCIKFMNILLNIFKVKIFKRTCQIRLIGKRLRFLPYWTVQMNIYGLLMSKLWHLPLSMLWTRLTHNWIETEIHVSATFKLYSGSKWTPAGKRVKLGNFNLESSIWNWKERSWKILAEVEKFNQSWSDCWSWKESLRLTGYYWCWKSQ